MRKLIQSPLLSVLSVLTIVALAVAAVGCSHGGKLKLNTSENKVVKGGIVSLSASQIKIRKNKFDVNFVIGNESGKDIIIVLDDLQCFKGAAKGSLNPGMHGNGSTLVDFHAGETKTFRFVCTLASATAGDPRILVKNVYANPGGDGIKIGNVLTENAEWTLPGSEKPAAAPAPTKAAPDQAANGDEDPVSVEVINNSAHVETMPAMEPVKTKKKK